MPTPSWPTDQFVMVPMRAPALIGWVVKGFPLDQALIDDMQAVSGLQTALVAQPMRSAARLLVHRLKPPAEPAALAAQLADGDLQGMLAMITVLGLVLFGAGSLWSAGRVTQPVRHDGRHDEIGELARAFDHMRINVAAQRGEIRDLAYRDRLTGLPNRLQFRERVQQAIARADVSGDALAVLMLDLDRFKHVNDVLGYASGDRRLLSELRRAVEGRELRLFLQPKIDIRTGAVCGAEALVRWQHPTCGLVPPMQFIPFAEQTGFNRQLTLWIFEQAAAEQGTLAVLGVRRVSVNLSTRDLMDQDLPEKLDYILRRHRAIPEGFCLEITESAIMDDPQRAEATLNRLSERGYKLSIDDFGTGCSSLAYLKKLPVDELKIDKRFVMAMERDAGDVKIVRSTIDLAPNLGLTVEVERIENEAVLALLHTLNCDEGPGHHMGKPLPVPEFCDWVARWQVRPPVAAGTPAELRAGAPLLH